MPVHGPQIDFVGLNLDEAPENLQLGEAVVANNLVVNRNHVTARPGRVELAWRESHAKFFNLKGFFDGTTRSLVIFGSDGVFIYSE